MISKPNAGGRGRVLALAVGAGLLAFVLGAGFAGRGTPRPTVSPATTSSTSTTTTTTAPSSTSAATVAEPVDMGDRPTVLVLATATQLIAVDLERGEARILDEIDTGLGIPPEEFHRVQLGEDGFVYFDRIRNELRGTTFRVAFDGEADSVERLIEGVSPAVQVDRPAGRTRLVTLGRRDRAEIVISDIGPDGTIDAQQTIAAEANTVPKLRHPSWAPLSLGSAHVIVEWIEFGRASQLIVVDVDRATSLDEDDRAAPVIVPDNADWTLPVWPGEDIRVIARSADAQSELIAANPDGRDAKTIADSGDVIHHSHDASGADSLIVDGEGAVLFLDDASWESLDFGDIVIDTDGSLASLTTKLEGQIVAADW